MHGNSKTPVGIHFRGKTRVLGAGRTLRVLASFLSSPFFRRLSINPCTVEFFLDIWNFISLILEILAAWWHAFFTQMKSKNAKVEFKLKWLCSKKKNGRLPMSFQKWHMPTFLSWKMCHSLIRDLLLLFGQRSAAKTLFLFLFQNDQSCDFASGIGSE